MLHNLNRQEGFDADIIRKYLVILDLEEYKRREKPLHPAAAEA